jgi:hypothetical protein
MSVIKRLSQTLGQLRKGYAVDTKQGGYPVEQTLFNVPAVSATAIHAAVTLTTVAQTISTAITNPTIYRTLSVTGNGAGVYGSVTIYGKNWADQTISETIIASGSGAIKGNMPFKTVKKIVFPARVAPGDTISVGISDKLGLYRPLFGATSASLIEVQRRASAGTSYAKETAPTIDATYDTILPNGGITAADNFKVSYLSDIF